MAERYADELEELARKRLKKQVYRYFLQGAREGVSAAEAAESWSRLRFLPRVLQDVTVVDTSTTLLGTPVSMPVGVAPSTLQRAAHADGDVGMARAVQAAGGVLVVSSNTGTTFEEIGATGVSWWLQMYLTADRASSMPVVRRALEAGARALVLTADTPVVGTKYGHAGEVWDVVDPAHLRANFADPRLDVPGLEKATDLGPHDIAWLRERFEVPVVVKGVLHPTDARRCVDAGAEAVWVSNHGGRQLDRALPTAEALPAVVQQVGSDAEVYVDGGIRRGSDVVAALALGARAAFLGRPPLWALSVDGSDGVRRLLTELGEEIVEGLRLSGCGDVSSVPPDLVVPPRPPA